MFIESFIRTFDYKKNNYYKRNGNPSKYFRQNIPINMNQCRLKVAYTTWPPYIMNMNNRNESGLEGELIFLIGDIFNVRFIMDKYDYTHGNMLHVIAIDHVLNIKKRNFKLRVILTIFSIILKDKLLSLSQLSLGKRL